LIIQSNSTEHGDAHGLSDQLKERESMVYFIKSKERLLSYRDNVDAENTKESTNVAEEVLNANLKTKMIKK